MRPLLLLAAALAAAPAGGETLTRELGPLRLEGRSEPMKGPESESTFRFEKPGFVTAVSVRVLDAAGRSRNHEGLNCHSLFNAADLAVVDAAGPGRKSGITAEADRFGLSDNQPEIRFPAGFGVRVEPGRDYLLFGQLQDPEGKHPGDYRLQYRFELAPADPPLRELTGLLVKVQRGAGAEPTPHDCGPLSLWTVPPGRHRYVRAFTLPYDARLHYVSTHVHRHAEELSLVDAATGKALLSAKVRHNASGELDASPVYSSAEGLPLRKGRRYEFRIVYDNPGPGVTDAMGNLRLFVAAPKPETGRVAMEAR